jgi:hypothetical protein
VRRLGESEATRWLAGGPDKTKGGYARTSAPSATTAKPTQIWAGNGGQTDTNDREVRLRVTVGPRHHALRADLDGPHPFLRGTIELPL